MTERVLAPMDGAVPSKLAFEYALSEHPDAGIAVLHVIGFLDSDDHADRIRGDRRLQYDRTREKVGQISEVTGKEVENADVDRPADVAFGPPCVTVPEYAGRSQADSFRKRRPPSTGFRDNRLRVTKRTARRYRSRGAGGVRTPVG